MLTRLWCWLFGHKRYEKAFTGQYFDTYDALTRQPIKGTLYQWQRSPFCLRCGADREQPNADLAKPEQR